MKKDLMHYLAELVFENVTDCCEICDYKEKCLRGSEFSMPPQKNCIDGIINYGAREIAKNEN